jgi:hypothetical protein
METSGSRAAALQRVTDLANELAAGRGDARELVRELFVAFREVEREFSRPKPIAEAPRGRDRTLLLYCPKQGGWHAGEWFQGRWVPMIDQTQTLEPSHWLPAPEQPQQRDSPVQEKPIEEVLIERIRDLAGTGAFDGCSEIALALQHDPEFDKFREWFANDMFAAQIDQLCKQVRDTRRKFDSESPARRRRSSRA